MNNISYEIKPIFAPSANICHDFARIQYLSSKEKLSDLVEYQRSFAYNNLGNAYLNTWNMETNVFAFAAYVAEEMVGFITGSLTGKSMFTRSLYVTPQYQGCGIGTSLLNSAENAASLVAPHMELFSLSGAVSFYQNRGYQSILVLGRIKKTKRLSNVTGVIPVFNWCDALQSKLNMHIDTNLLQKAEHQPIFVYVNEQQKIDGIATRMPNGEQKIKTKNLPKLYANKLSAALNRTL